ncbi:hypothetical protein CJ179_36130 [Rhodococcus sp. ACS1]|nr:hypothetical protein CJ179_36130 [Rhodococcus sp. ACS1]
MPASVIVVSPNRGGVRRLVTELIVDREGVDSPCSDRSPRAAASRPDRDREAADQSGEIAKPNQDT